MAAKAPPRQRCSAAAACVLACLLVVAGAVPPRATGGTREVRLLNVATVYPEPRGVRHDQFRLLTLDVEFSHPLFVSARESTAAPRPLTSDSVDALSRADAFVVECPALERNFSLGDAEHAGWRRDRAYWAQPSETLKAPYAATNPMGEVLRLWRAEEDVERDHHAHHHSLSLMLTLAHRRHAEGRDAPSPPPPPSSSSSSPPLWTDDGPAAIEDCWLVYRPARRGAVDRVTNFRGAELNMRVRIGELRETATAAKNVARLAAHEEAWLADVRERAAAGGVNSSTAESLALAEVESQVQIMSKILDPITSGVMKPVIETTVEYMSQDIMPVFTDDLVNAVSAYVLPDLNTMLSEVLLANLTNILVDSVTHTLSQSLSFALTRALGPFLVNAVHDKLAPILHEILNDVLTVKIPTKLNEFLPEVIDRVLSLTLTHGLTRSLTHTLVPTLTHTITHTRKADKFCEECYYHQRHCSFCHFSRESLYYQNYHASYFADFFSDYYALYYANAFQAVDAVMYPDFNGLETGGDVGFAAAEG